MAEAVNGQVTTCVDLRVVPTGSAYCFAIAFALATLLAIYVVFRIADLVLLTGRHNAQIAGLATPLVLWPTILLLAWLRDRRSIQQTQGAQPLDERVRTATARMYEVCSKLGVAPPRLVVTSEFNNRDVWVCGLRRPWILVVERLFAKQALRDPQLFDAAIAHELAHIASGDARRLALFRALGTVLTILLLAAFGIPCVRTVLEFGAALPKVWLAEGFPVAWGMQQASQIFGQYVAPILVGAVAFRLGYARLLRRQEALADWRAAASGYGKALRDAAAARSQSSSLLQVCLSPFQVFPTPAKRARLLSEPTLYDRTAGADYLLLGGLIAFLACCFHEMDIESFVGAQDISELISAGKLDQLTTLDTVTITYVLVTGTLLIAIFWGACFFFVRDAAALLLHGRHMLRTSFRAAAFLVVGVITGNMLWVGNVAEPGFFYLEDGFHIGDALLLSGKIPTAVCMLFTLFTNFAFLSIALKWRIRRFGLARHTSLLFFEVVLLSNLGFSILWWSCFGLALLFNLIEFSLIDRWDLLKSALLVFCITLVILAISLKFVSHHAIFASEMRQLAPFQLRGCTQSVSYRRIRLKRFVVIGGWLLVAGLGCATVSLVLDRRALVIEAISAPGHRLPTVSETQAFGDAISQRLRIAALTPEIPVYLAAEGGTWVWLQTLAARLDRREAARRFVVALRGPPLGFAAESGSVGGAASGQIVVALAMPDTPADMMERFASATLQATFPTREILVRLKEDPGGSTAKRTAEFALARWPHREATWSSVQLLLGTILEDTDREKAHELYNAVLKSGFLKEAAATNLGRLALSENKLEVAIDLHRQAVRIAPWSATSHFELAVAFRISGLAEQDVTAALQLHQQACRELRLAVKLGFNFSKSHFGPEREQNDPVLSCKAQ